MNISQTCRATQLLGTFFALLLIGSSTLALASSSNIENTSTGDAQFSGEHLSPWINMNIGIEVTGLENAADKAAEGLVLIGTSLEELSNTQELTPEQLTHIQRSLARVEDLGDNLSKTVQALPGTVEKSFEPVVQVSNDLASKVHMTIVITAVALVIILLVALAAFYQFVLVPATRAIVDTTSLLNELAKTLETTAEIVDRASTQNQYVLDEIREIKSQPPQTGVSL